MVIGFRSVLLVSLFWTLGITQTPLDPDKTISTKSPYELVVIDDSQTIIEEKSLIFQSGVFGTQQSQAIPGSRPVGQNSNMTERTEDSPNAFRCYGFFLEPGETLRLHLKGNTENMICMKFLSKIAADGMSSQIKRSNMMPTASRKSKIEITNILSKRYQVAVMLYGQANYPYILEIERLKK